MAVKAAAMEGLRSERTAAPSQLHALSLAIAGLGAAYMLLLVFGLFLPPEGPYIGTRLYDLYATALFDGRFELPVRELRLEGHYAPDGTGYLYHGFGPLLTRLPFIAFVQFPTNWIAPLSIWFWAVAGNICVHRTFSFALIQADFGAEGVPSGMRTLLAIAVWFGAPGIILSANSSLFYEPVAMAYALGAGFVLLFVRMAYGAIRPEKALIPLAVLAGLVMHARPHLAIGYSAAVCLLAFAAARRSGRSTWSRVALAFGILGLSGALLIASNALRFGDPGQMHGTFGKSEVQYGWVFWGAETEDSARALGYLKYGQFNARRVLPNAAMYLAAPPVALIGEEAAERVEDLFHFSEPSVKFMRIEQPNVGILFLWLAWTILAAAGLRQKALWRMPALAGMVGVGSGALLMLSYGTITLRYHVDLWPLFAFPAAFGVAPLVAWARRRPEWGGGRRWVLGLSVLVGVIFTSLAVGGSRNALLDDDRSWSHEACLRLAGQKGFDALHGEKLCRIGYK